jgi:hypothetical protein
MADEEKFDFELKKPFKYGKKGLEVEAQFITLLPHSSRHMSYCADLKQAVFQALPKPDPDAVVEDDEEKEDSRGLTGLELLLMIYKSDVSLKQVLLTAAELFTIKPSVALIDGEQKLTKPLIDVMDPDEFEQMTGEYICRFIVASAFASLKEL